MVRLAGLSGALALALWAAVAATGARADAAAEARAIESAWRAWAADSGVRVSTLAVTQGGRALLTAGMGAGPDAPRPLASLSKSITGACILALQGEGRLSLDAPVGELLARSGIAMTRDAAQITVAELLTHSSGLDRDSTQGRLSPWRASGGDRTLGVAAAALARVPGPKRFAYNNENYAVLGAIVIAVTGEPAARACPPRVLAPLGLAAGVSQAHGGGVPWGGFEMSAPDFARFAAALRARAGWPRAPMGGGAAYGPGVMLKDAPGGAVLWHFGSWCFVLGRSSGAYFFQLPEGLGVAVTWDGCLGSAHTRALDEALSRAIR